MKSIQAHGKPGDGSDDWPAVCVDGPMQGLRLPLPAEVAARGREIVLPLNNSASSDRIRYWVWAMTGEGTRRRALLTCCPPQSWPEEDIP